VISFLAPTGGKARALVAEDRESMMLWILALQARQDKAIPELPCRGKFFHQRKQLQPSSNNTQPNMHKQVAASVKSKVLQRTHSLQLNPERRHDPLKRMHSLWTSTSQEEELIPNVSELHSKFVKKLIHSKTNSNQTEYIL
ncbi:PH domain-containing protein, partial [Caerostris extrusa]